MDDAENILLRKDVEAWLRRAMDQIKLVKDVEFRKSVEEKLEKLNELILRNQSIATNTLEECRKVILTAWRKTFSKLVLENLTDCNSNGTSSSLQSSPRLNQTGYVTLSENSIPPSDQITVGTEQRLALKYPRKKIGTPGNSSTSDFSSNSEDTSTSTLFKRRHEVFAPPPQPTTYGEHKRIMQQLKEDARNQNTPKVEVDNRITKKNDEKSSYMSRDLTKTEPELAHADVCLESDNPITETKENTSSDMSRDFAKTESKLAHAHVCVKSTAASSLLKLCNINHTVDDNTEIVSTNDVNEVSSEMVNATTHQQSASECPTTNTETNGDTADHDNENVEKLTPVIPAKPSHKNKVNHRELHDLLSYTTEIFPKLSRRKSVWVEDDTNMRLLKQFGITRTVQIVLQRPGVAQPQIAHRTRSKSIDSTKYLKNLNTAKQTVPVHNKISHRRESKSMEVKKQTAMTTTSKAVKRTARKSVSKPQHNVQSINSSNHRNANTNVINNVPTQKEHKMAKPNTASVKRTRRSPSPPPAKRTRRSPSPPPAKRTRRSPSPPLAKRTRSSKNISTDIRAVENDVKNLGEDSDADEPIVLLSNVVLNGNPPPNNDPKVHCHSDYMKKCCLCSYQGEVMVRHYVYNHPKKAVYVSRIAPEQAELIRADPFAISGRKAVSRYGDQEIIVFRCYFCDLRLSESQDLWLDHISKHTGEYRYKCMLCPTFARLPIDRVTHHLICTKPSMQLWHTYTFEENHLYAYMCNKCNFVQVLFVNMKRHLREDHPEADKVEVGFTKFSLVNFNLHDDDTELPYGRVKLEPILDDTNVASQENIEQEVEFTLIEDCQTHHTAPLRAIDPKQHLVQSEFVFVKHETVCDSIDQCETNPSDNTADKGCDTYATFSASDPQEKSQCTSSSSVRVKERSGDILSTTVNKVPVIVARNSNPVDRSTFLNEYIKQLKDRTNNAGSTVANKSTIVCLPNNRRTIGLTMVPLQPWNGTNDLNKMIIQKNKLTVLFLAAAYKCTAYDCGFYTDSSQTIGFHYQIHQKPTTLHPITRDSSWLECCYCSYASLSVHHLLKHIDTVHKYSAYQCDRCCYRSRDPNSVRVHQRNYHIEHDADAKILCIPGRQKEYTSIDRDIIMNELKSNVKILQCAHCSMRKFNDLEQYRNHIKMHGVTYIACHVCDQLMSATKMIGHISLHNMFMIQCVYCDFGVNDLQTIKKHVADKHSDKLLCYHIRSSKPNVPPFIRVRDKISPGRFVNC